MIVGRLVEVCKRMILNVNADERNVMKLGGEEGSVIVAVRPLEPVSEFSNSGVLHESDSQGVECYRKVACEKSTAGEHNEFAT